MSPTASATSHRSLSLDLLPLPSGRLALLRILQLLNLACSIGLEFLSLKTLVDRFNLFGLFRHFVVLPIRVGIDRRGFGKLSFSV
jgi:hypothetical protein